MKEFAVLSQFTYLCGSALSDDLHTTLQRVIGTTIRAAL
jgi:hypothetical protein